MKLQIYCTDFYRNTLKQKQSEEIMINSNADIHLNTSYQKYTLTKRVKIIIYQTFSKFFFFLCMKLLQLTCFALTSLFIYFAIFLYLNLI